MYQLVLWYLACKADSDIVSDDELDNCSALDNDADETSNSAHNSAETFCYL